MAKNTKVDDKDNQEDVRWLENYEEHCKTEKVKSLKNKDILNYIKDMTENCRLEVSSGDEDYAGTKRSSDCSVRFSDMKFRSSKKGKSKVLSKRNKSAVSRKKRVKQSSTCVTKFCSYCCFSRKSDLCKIHDLNNKKSCEKDVSTFSKSVRHYPVSSTKRNSYQYNESSPRFHGSYSRRNHKMWPTVTEKTSLEIVQDIIPDSTVDESQILSGRKSTNVRTSKSLRRRRLGESTRANIYSNITTAERQRSDPYCRVYEQAEDAARRTMGKLNEESDVSDFAVLLGEFHSNRDTAAKLARSYPTMTPSRKVVYKEYPHRRHLLRRSLKQATSWNPSSRSNRLSAWPSEISSQERASRLRGKVRSPLRASTSPIIGTTINKSYRRAREGPADGTDRQRREPHIAGVRGPPYYHRRPNLFRQTGSLHKVAREGKQPLGCYFKDVGRDETGNCSTCCYCPENESIHGNYLPRCNTYRAVRIGKQIGYTEREVPSKPDLDLLAEENLRGETAAFDRSDGAINHNDKIDEDSEPRVSIPDDRAYRGRRLSGEFNNSRQKEKRESRGKISGAEFSRAIKTSGKLASGNSSRQNVAEFMCDCREPFHDSPACLAGSCTCIGNNEDAEKDDSDSSMVCCCCCRCCFCSSSVSSCDEKDPVKKLESFCEKVKAMNRSVFDKPSTYHDAARTNDAQRYSDDDHHQNQQSKINSRTVSQRPTERKWLEDPLSRRLSGRPKYDRTKLEKILIYPPRGETGMPLTLYKKSSNICCRVKGDANAGFRYSVTYVQKFVSPLWTPDLPLEVSSQETDEECDCSADYG